jgi:hypothetical protein
MTTTESIISIARATNRNVTRSRDGQMVLRWTAMGADWRFGLETGGVEAHCR